jgi:hypothetical protein
VAVTNSHQTATERRIRSLTQTVEAEAAVVQHASMDFEAGLCLSVAPVLSLVTLAEASSSPALTVAAAAAAEAVEQADAHFSDSAQSHKSKTSAWPALLPLPEALPQLKAWSPRSPSSFQTTRLAAYT